MLQQDPIKDLLNNQDNISSNPRRFLTEDIYPPNQPPPPYIPQWNGNGITFPPSVEQLYQRAKILTVITPKLRAFLIISGCIYITWSLATIGLELFIALRSQFTSYRSIWPSVLVLYAGVNMSLIGCRVRYRMNKLIPVFCLVLLFCVYGLILLAINCSISIRCPSQESPCDNQIITNSKIGSLILTNKDGIYYFVFLFTFNLGSASCCITLNEGNFILMGCCKSSPDIEISRSDLINSVRNYSPLTQAETTQFETILSGIPVHYRQIILNLPPRQLLDVYQYHTMALQSGLRREWSLAISFEHRALKRLQALLPTQKDHYIFFNFYTVLSASFLALGEFEVAIEGLYVALAILIKYTPMDYRTISGYNHYLAQMFEILQEWKAAAHYLTKAIQTARLMTDFDQNYIDILEAELQITKERIANDMSHNTTYAEVKRKQSKSDHDFHRRSTVPIITFSAKYGTLRFHQDVFKYLSNNIYRDSISDDC